MRLLLVQDHERIAGLHRSAVGRELLLEVQRIRGYLCGQMACHPWPMNVDGAGHSWNDKSRNSSAQWMLHNSLRKITPHVLGVHHASVHWVTVALHPLKKLQVIHRSTLDQLLHFNVLQACRRLVMRWENDSFLQNLAPICHKPLVYAACQRRLEAPCSSAMRLS